jgi:hypothetical protein
MGTFAEAMQIYHQQLLQGEIQQAYRGLMEYMSALKTELHAKYPDYPVSGSLYFGYMDMTYFAILPPALKDKGLKVAVVFLHEAFRFEVWLSGVNRQVQDQYRRIFSEKGFKGYRLVSSSENVDAILESTLLSDPNFDDLPGLTGQIEKGTLAFISDVEAFLYTIDS